MPYPAIDPRRLQVFPLSQRRNLLRVAELAEETLAVDPAVTAAIDDQIGRLAERILAARQRGAAVMLTYGAHLIKNGAGPLLNCLIEAGLVTHLATQGAGIIHDWEFAFQAESGESVRENAPAGTFGSWDETGRWLNLAVLVGAAEGLGLGEAVGRLIAEDQLVLPTAERLRQEIAAEPGHPLAAAKADLLWTIETHRLPTGTLHVVHPHKNYSVPAAAYRHRVPFTVHPGIGYDIIVNHPLYHGGAIGRAATTDVRIFTASVDRLDGGVYLSVGSAIMSPQVFEKAFSAANNLRTAEHRPLLSDHYLAIVDLQDGGGWDWSRGEPPATIPRITCDFARVSTAWAARWTTSAATTACCWSNCCGGWESIRPPPRGPAAVRFRTPRPDDSEDHRMKTFRGMTPARLQEIVERFPGLRIGVIGDFFLDKYLEIDPLLAEVSLETGKTAHQVVGIRHSPGAAGTVVCNLAALGTGTLHAIGLTGDDGESYELRKDLAALGCTTDHLYCDLRRSTPTYLKPRDKGDLSLAGEHNRYDTKNRGVTPEDLQQRIVQSLDLLLPQLDAVIALDQVEETDCGVITAVMAATLAERARRYPHVVFWADSRRRIRQFRNMIIKPNQFEGAGVENPAPDAKVDLDELEASVRRLRAMTARRYVPPGAAKACWSAIPR